MTYKREFKNSMKNLKKDKIYMQTIKDVMQALEESDGRVMKKRYNIYTWKIDVECEYAGERDIYQFVYELNTKIDIWWDDTGITLMNLTTFQKNKIVKFIETISNVEGKRVLDLHIKKSIMGEMENPFGYERDYYEG